MAGPIAAFGGSSPCSRVTLKRCRYQDRCWDSFNFCLHLGESRTLLSPFPFTLARHHRPRTTTVLGPPPPLSHHHHPWTTTTFLCHLVNVRVLHSSPDLLLSCPVDPDLLDCLPAAVWSSDLDVASGCVDLKPDIDNLTMICLLSDSRTTTQPVGFHDTKQEIRRL